MRDRRAAVDLFLISALGLFVELMLIRRIASEVRIFAFYKNFALIAAFLGLGIGFAIRRQGDKLRGMERLYLPLMAITVLIVLALGRTAVSELILANRADSREWLWARTAVNLAPFARVLLDVLFYSILLSMFVLLTALFIPLGLMTANRFAVFSPLPGYTINVMGSLVGILLYTLVSFLGWPPAAWFAVAGLGALYFIPRQQRVVVGVGAIAAAVPALLTLLWPHAANRTIWSPYYRIDIYNAYAEDDPSVQVGYHLTVNQSWHQGVWNLDPRFVAEHHDAAPANFDGLVAEYGVPYQAASSLDEVLIVGAGTGNDVAGALRAGAGHITAVEIDPFILQLGRDLHPEHPYSDTQRVTAVTEDARSFFQRSQDKYNLIVFGLLDSHTLFSSASSIRLDNFVYTRESLSAARDLLTDDGMIVISFYVSPEFDWVGVRQAHTLNDVFGHAPQVYTTPAGNTMFFIKREPMTEPIVSDGSFTLHPDYLDRYNLTPLTDDWPFLYLRDRSLPTPYLITLAGVLVVALLLIRRALPDFREISGHFLFMGAAFFLLETKSITEMALLLGSTWIVNAAVIAAILTMIVIANILVERLHLSDPRPFYGLLALALLFNYFVPVGSFLALELLPRVALASVAQALPLFFAGIIFAITFSKAASIELALGSNLLGSVLGGTVEYVSLVVGIRSLYLLALLFYLLSALPILLPRLSVHSRS